MTEAVYSMIWGQSILPSPSTLLLLPPVLAIISISGLSLGMVLILSIELGSKTLGKPTGHRLRPLGHLTYPELIMLLALSMDTKKRSVIITF